MKNLSIRNVLFIVLGAMFMINNKSKKFFEIELLINENI
jgi:hypothetical protein